MTDEEKEKEFKRLRAIASADEAYEALVRIGSLREFLKSKLVLHNVTVQRNLDQRACGVFHERLKDLGITDMIHLEVY